MRRASLFLAIAALLATGCSRESTAAPPTEAATDEVLAIAYATAGPVEQADTEPDAVPDDCRVEVEIDEYGFETEVLRCDGREVPDGATDALEVWLDSLEARRTAQLIRNLVVLQTGCTRAGHDHLAALEDIAETAPTELQPHLEAAISSLQRSGRACNTDVTRWRRQLGNALDSLEEMIDVIEEHIGG